MSFRGTRGAAEAPGLRSSWAGLVRKVADGAEDRVRAVLGRAGAQPWRLAAFSVGLRGVRSLAPDQARACGIIARPCLHARRWAPGSGMPGGFLAPARYAGPALQGPACPRRGGSGLHASDLHGRRLSRPALELLGPGRRERSDRRTRRVAVASTCDTIGHHDVEQSLLSAQAAVSRFAAEDGSGDRESAGAEGREVVRPQGAQRPRHGSRPAADSACRRPSGRAPARKAATAGRRFMALTTGDACRRGAGPRRGCGRGRAP